MQKPGRAPRRRWRTSVGVATLSLVLGALAYAMHDASPVGRFRTEEGRLAYAASYAAAMKRLPAPARSFDLATGFGTVRLYEFGPRTPSDATPVLLLPGRGSGVPMWEANIQDIAAERTVYALDALGDAGMSVQTRPLRDSADQAAWLDEVLAKLGSPAVHLVGHSFGGWSAANYAVRHPARVASLLLIEPVFVFQGLRPQVYIVSLPASLPFLPRSWRERMLSRFGGADTIDPDDPMARMIADAIEHYAPGLPLPERLAPEALQGLGMPVYVALASQSYMHDTHAAAQVARQSVRHLHLTVWPETTHSLPMEVSERLNRELLEFMTAHDRQ